MPKRSWPEMQKAMEKGLAEDPQAPRAKDKTIAELKKAAAAARSSGKSGGGGGPIIDSFFSSVDPEPLAAASIGQVSQQGATPSLADSLTH